VGSFVSPDLKIGTTLAMEWLSETHKFENRIGLFLYTLSFVKPFKKNFNEQGRVSLVPKESLKF